MVTNEQNISNLAFASYLAAESLGLGEVNSGDFTQSERIAFTRSLALYVVNHPDQFTAASVLSAQIVLGHNAQGMELDDYINTAPDGSASLANIFVNTLGDQVLRAGGSIANVGNGVLNLLNQTGNVITNTGNAAANLTGSASNSWVIVAVIAVALGIAASSVSREARQWRS